MVYLLQTILSLLFILVTDVHTVVNSTLIRRRSVGMLLVWVNVSTLVNHLVVIRVVVDVLIIQARMLETTKWEKEEDALQVVL